MWMCLYFFIGFLHLALVWRWRNDLPVSAPFALLFCWPLVLAIVVRDSIREYRLTKRFERDQRAMLNNQALLRELEKTYAAKRN